MQTTTFFLRYENSIVHLSEKLKLFSDFSGLKPNTTKCEVAGIGVLKGVQVAVCGMKSFFENNLILPALTPQTALLGFWSDNTNHDKPIINHFLLIFKLYVYNLREKHRLSIMDLLTDIKK